MVNQAPLPGPFARPRSVEDERLSRESALQRFTAEWESVLLSRRGRYHASFRLASRAYQMALARRSTHPVRLCALAAVCALADLAGTVALSNHRRFALGPRLAADVVDTALWGVGDGRTNAAVLTGVPLAMEAGMRMGIGALVIPVAHAAVGAALRRRVRRLPSTASYRWPVLGVCAGVMLRSLERNHHQALAAHHAKEMEALVQQHEVAGQGAVALGADSVVDLLSRTLPLLASDRVDAAMTNFLASWKQHLAEQAAGHATFLGLAVASWRQAHNSQQSDLRAVVNVQVAEGDGTVLLTTAQTEHLTQVLEAMALCGDVTMAVTDREQALLPGQPRQLTIAGQPVVIPADAERALVRFDPGPLALVLGALWTLDTLTPSGGATAPWAVVPVAAAGLWAARWANRRLRQVGEAARRDVVVATIGYAAVQGLATTCTLRRPSGSDDIQRFPFLVGMDTLATLLAFYHGQLPPYWELTAWGAGLAIVLVGLRTLGSPVDKVDFAAECLWPMTAVVGLGGLGAALDAAGRRLVSEQAGDDAQTLDAAYRSGRQTVIDLVGSVRDDVVRVLDDLAATGDDPLARVARHRIAEVDRRLEDLRCTTP